MRTAAPIERDSIAAFYTAWQDFVEGEIASAPQRDCIPRLIPSSAHVERRGAVMMFHGFSGCPQQFFALAAKIAERGFDVLLPLHPGHGRQPDADGNEDLSRLPQAQDRFNAYAEFAAHLNQIMARSPGKKVAVGFSLGGAIALNASLNAPELYDRLLLLSPLLAIRGGAIVEALIGMLGKIPGFRTLPAKSRSIRHQCHAWQATGRAGFCDYRIKDALALLQLEDINRRLYAENAVKIPIQIVTAGDEKYVSNALIADFFARHSAFGPISLCTLPADVPHEMLSPYENTGQQMYWLGGLLTASIEFVADGRFIAVKNFDGGQRLSNPYCLLN